MKFFSIWTALLLSCMVWTGCGSSTEIKEDEKPLARVGESYLYASDTDGIGAGMSDKDSLYQLNIHIQQWISDQLMLRVAKKNVTVTNRMRRMVADYEANLVMTSYERQLIKEQMDTEVTLEQLAAYYAENKEQYQSGISWIQCHFVKARRDLEGIQDLRKWFKSDDEADFERVKLFCANNKTIHILNKDLWIKYDKVVRELPDGSVERRHRKGESTLDRSDDDYIYLFKAFNYRDKEDATPLPQVKDEITRIILHLRHNEILRSIRRQVYEEGKENGRFEIFE